MSENYSTVHLFGVGNLVWWGFIAIKVWGHIFAAWSWWWLLCPIVPYLGEAVRHFGL